MTHSTDHTLDHSTSIDHCPALYCHHITDHTNDHLTDHSPSYQADILASIWHPRNYPTVIYYAVRDNWPLHNRSFTFILFRTIWPLYNQHATFISFEQLDQYICCFFLSDQSYWHHFRQFGQSWYICIYGSVIFVSEEEMVKSGQW